MTIVEPLLSRAGKRPVHDASVFISPVSETSSPVSQFRALEPWISPARENSASTGLFDLVGNTPLLRLRAWESAGVELYLKAEWFNPGGSVKDRAARHILLDAERRGLLTSGKVLIDASSGNTAIAYAMLGAARGYPVHIFLPENANVERKRLLSAYGARVTLTDPMEGSDGAIRRVRETVAADPERYFYADQYSNEANWRAHYETTGPELWAQTGGRVTHFVAGLGTSGTCMGVGRYLKEKRPGVEIVAVQPDTPLHGLEGLKHMETALRPGIYDPTVHDRVVEVDTEEAQGLARRLVREGGVFVGVSGAAAVVAGLSVAREVERRGESGVVVMVAPDGGSRYLSEHWWHPPQQQG